MISFQGILFLLVFTAVSAFQITDQCNNDTCMCCADNNCTDNGYCNIGCKQEYPECTVVSLADDQCRESHCKCCSTDKCNMSNGQCSDGCKPGYHGGRCKNKCPENCITCTDHPDVGQNRPDLNGIGYCIECKEGHYLTIDLYQCQSTCSSEYCQSVNQCKDNNCKCCANDECSEYGYCNRGCKPAFPKCIVVGVEDGQCGKSDCKCCATNRCDTTSGVCSDGCKPGYHGGRCKNKCPEYCINCTDHPDAGQNKPKLNSIGYCTECKEGHFFTDDLYQCQSTCSSGCKACTSKSRCLSCVDGHIPDLQNPGSCILCVTVCLSCQVNGCSSCKEGYFITSIQEYNLCDVCPDGCLSCVSNRSCTLCVSGWYGTSCQKVCSVGCKTTCKQDDGYCECKHEFTGHKCDTCIRGSYGLNCTGVCSNNCKNSECDTVSGKCFECVGNHVMPTCDSCINGYYGVNCDMNCPSNCLNNSCELSTGNCRLGCNENFASKKCDECMPGKYGSTCQRPCPANCNHSLCMKDSGYCLSCTPNFVGKFCDHCVDGKYNRDCSSSCPTNCTNNSCEHDNGNCFACTFNQTYGQKCNRTCPPDCLKGTCKKEDGHCDNGCVSGYSGEKCDECEAGRYGAYCEHNCSLNCKDTICDKGSGDCVTCVNINYLMPKCKNCTAGLYGVNCNIKCSINCKDSLCEKVTGKCSFGCIGNFSGETCNECIIGKFGNECVYDCPKRCLNNTCGVTSGICEDCNANFAGGTCEECFDGLYGVECNQTCPPNCRENICDQQTGVCKSGCSSGYSGDMCCLNNSFCEKCLSFEECDSCIDGKHGQTCEYDCSMNCKHRLCNRMNGSCYGCNDGFREPFCSDAVFHPNKEEDINIAAPITGILSAIAILSLSIVFIVLYHRRRYTRIKENNPRFEEAEERIYENANISVTVQPARPAAETTQKMRREHTQSVHNEAFTIPLNEMKISKSDDRDESNYYKTPEISSTKIQVSSLADHVKRQNSALFIKEFQALPKGLLKPCTDARKPENLAKNRYNSIYPYDDDRVKLNPPGSDFINACYIDGYKKKREYIASLGPIIKATEDFKTFWRMVWQENTEKIVMVTNLFEKGGMKCEKYWPDVCTTNSYGDVIVTCHSEEIFAEYTLSYLTVFQGDERRSLYHIHYTAWPDKAVPDDVTSIIDFRQKVNTIRITANGRTIVHCSAGVGRTGTYIALDILTQEGETEGTVDVFGRVSRMRHQRTHMVQTWEQYEYLHHALVHTVTFDYRPIAAEEFEEYVSTCSDAVMVANFKRLHSVKENVPESEGKAKQRNNLLQHLNRKDADVPGDIRRPRLYEGKTERDNDYINAIYLNSYRQKDRYIMAMTPLPETVTDFLTLLIQEKVTCVVSLNDEDSEHLLEHHVKGTYLPTDNQTLEIGAFVVKSCRVTSNSCYEQRSLQVTMDTVTETKSQTLHHFQINHWPEGTRVPHYEARFLQLITEAEKATDDREENGTMVVHCLNAAERSCLFCAISIMLQKMDTDHEVSVVNTLRQVRVRRPLAIPNKEQYVFCHKCICTHLQSGDSNRKTNLSMRR